MLRAHDLRRDRFSPVGFVPWEDPQNVENTLVRIAPKTDTPSANPQPPFGWLYGFQAQDIATLIRGVTVEGSDDALSNPWVETVGFFEGALCPSYPPLHLRPQRRLTSSWGTTRPA